MAAADRLSALADDLLQHILSFTSVKEAAASAILSRRWRPVWRSTRVLNLDSRPYPKSAHNYYTPSPTYDAFFRDANAALAAFRPRRRRGRRGDGSTGLRRLTLFLVVGAYRRPDTGYNNRKRDAEPEDDARVIGLLADPAASRLEELIVACDHRGYERQYLLPLASMPCAATLRVLELRSCYLEPTSPGIAFPRLTDLTLRDCSLLEGYLQVVVDAAPALTSLALVNVSHKRPGAARKSFIYASNCFVVPLRLRSPTVTALVLRVFLSRDELNADKKSPDVGSGVELDMPSLRSFRYQGHPFKLSLTSPAPGLQRVDIDDSHREHYFRVYLPPQDMLTSFSSTRALTLRLSSFEDIIADGVTLPMFPNLELLDLNGKFEYRNEKTAAVLAQLLRSCPAMSELRLRLDMRHDYHYEQKTKDPVGGPFGESMARFERLAPMTAAHRSAVELGKVSEMPAALTKNITFSCLEKSLRKVTLQFKAKEVNCFQVQLAKFLVENAMVLEEMHIEDGIQFWPDHLCHKVARWRAASFQRKNLPDRAAGFRVFQLPNPEVDSKEQPRGKVRRT